MMCKVGGINCDGLNIHVHQLVAALREDDARRAGKSTRESLYGGRLSMFPMSFPLIGGDVSATISRRLRHVTTYERREQERIERAVEREKLKLENVTIGNALQLEAARRRAVPLRFNFVARVKFELALPIRCRLGAFLLLIRYVTL